MEKLFRKKKHLKAFINNHLSLEIDQYLRYKAFGEANNNFSIFGLCSINS